ncbi:MAG: hypothetical protein RMA76_33560 [Deltaproteobacteria bacterium]|jgi:hypothetical protein
MTISRGTMGAQIAQLMLEHGINSKKTSDLVRAASHRAEQAAIEVEAAHQKQANSLADAKGWIEVANSAVSVVRAGADMGTTIKEEGQRADAMPQLQEGVRDAQRGDDSALRDVELGDTGRNVGERFNDRQIEVLSDSDSINRMYEGHLADGKTPAEAREATIEDLQGMDFSEDEAESLFSIGRDRVSGIREGFIGEGLSEAEADRRTVNELMTQGFTREEAESAVAERKSGLSQENVANFIWANRKTEAEKLGEHFDEKWKDAFQQFVGNIGIGLDGAAEDHREVGSKARESQGDTEAIGDEAHSLAVQHQNAIDDILTQGLTGEQDKHKSGTA